MPDKHFRAGPKRLIDKRKGHINVVLNTSAQDFVLHTVTDQSTLTRIIFKAGLILDQAINVDIDVFCNWNVSVYPNGTRVVDIVTVSDVQDKAVIDEDLFDGFHRAMQNVDHDVSMKTQDISIDSKGNRKLSPGDTVVLSVDGSESSSANMIFEYKMFIKKA